MILCHKMFQHLYMIPHVMTQAADILIQLFHSEIKTGSPVIDVILMEKLREAKEKQIRFISDFHYPGDSLWLS